jgi:hypothetical protein
MPMHTLVLLFCIMLILPSPILLVCFLANVLGDSAARMIYLGWM